MLHSGIPVKFLLSGLEQAKFEEAENPKFQSYWFFS
jgi:hypothetical protein